MFTLSITELNRDELYQKLSNQSAGAIVVFEGWVRDHNQGKKVQSLEYQIYHELALKEGARILEEAKEKFNLHQVLSVHREGHLKLGEMAIWVGATASHRDDAFKATRYVIDEIKHRLPVWKKEHYVDEKPEWVFCRDHHHHVHFEEADFYSKQSKVIDQNKLKNARVLVVGAGGLGCPVLVSLATAGVGLIRIVDPDRISLSNIHRQFLYSPNLVGEKKVVVAKARLMELNPFIHVEAVSEFFKTDHLKDIDLVIDGTDSMHAKFEIHDACFKFQLPFVSAGVFKAEAQLRTFNPGQGCLRCLEGETPDDSLLGNCNDFGVLGAWTSVMGSLQASEAIEFLQTGTNTTSASTLYLNLKNLSTYLLKNFANKDCPVCRGEGDLLLNSLEVLHAQDGHIVDIRNMSDEEVAQINFQHSKTILCCHRGVRSKRLTQQLRSLGHESVFSLKGGANSLGE